MSIQEIQQLQTALDRLERVMVEESDRLSGEGLSRLAQAVEILRRSVHQDIVLDIV